MELRLYREGVERIRDHSDMLINLTTCPGGRFSYSKGKRLGYLRTCPTGGKSKTCPGIMARVVSLDVGSVNFVDSAFINLASHVEQMAQLIREVKVKPELEIFDAGHLRFAAHLIKTGLIVEPPLFQLCLGVPWGMETMLVTC